MGGRSWEKMEQFLQFYKINVQRQSNWNLKIKSISSVLFDQNWIQISYSMMEKILSQWVKCNEAHKVYLHVHEDLKLGK